MTKIIDVSSYNGSVNWSKCLLNGVGGAIIKIIRKDMSKDTRFEANYKGCNVAGIPWGVYNYSYATTVAKAKADMRIVCDILDSIDKKHFKLGVWFDIEDKVQASLSKSQIAEILNAAQAVVEERGYKFGIYTGYSYYLEHMDAKRIFCNNWWIARYYNGYKEMKIATDPNDGYNPSHSLRMLWAWQYTSSGFICSGACTGNSNRFDVSVQYKDFELHGYSGLWPRLPKRGHFIVGDGYKTLTDMKTEVKYVQKLLNWLIPGNQLTVDGCYGEKTAEKQKQAQRLFGLPVNGCYGKLTQDKAKKYRR